MKSKTKLVLFFSLVMWFLVSWAQNIEEPNGYKLDNYRSQTPLTLRGATVVDATKARQLYEKDEVIFIDVLPSPKRPETLPENEIWLPPKRLNIPGSIWLADVGFGVLSEQMDDYFKSNLEQFAQSDKKGMIFYCKANCWMSWNAAKRALEYGFADIYWFPGGTDDWANAGYQLVESKPKKK